MGMNYVDIFKVFRKYLSIYSLPEVLQCLVCNAGVNYFLGLKQPDIVNFSLIFIAFIFGKSCFFHMSKQVCIAYFASVGKSSINIINALPDFFL